MSNSECSSRCESGWTMYLDQHSYSTDPYSRGYHVDKYEDKGVYVNYDDQEDEDLSMVSDASSGPPHFNDYENCAVDTQFYGYSPPVSEDKKKNNNKQQKSKSKERKQKNLCLDDTASSPGNVPPSGSHYSVQQEGFSSAHFEGESRTKKHLGFFRSSTKGKSGSLLGRKRQ
ncbi:hypothetical protein Salat_0597600 [Sesamum alatum]|uniref:Uncharacterized protein n=1 Tax=Sesamum alatum TaxID=300844 RepID=A0AAE1YQZ7_9LAMI|nr:hypothetical protein Salat_0597600 [Sesamum alatum]